MKMLRPDFCTLKNLHDCANDLLSPVTQQALAHHRHERWVDEVSEGFLRVLDACGITRDVLFLVKEHLQHLQSALRRSRVAEQGLQNRIGAYHYSRNKMKKEMHKCLETLKGMTDSFTPSALSDSDHNVVSVVVVLREVRMITISIVQSILSLMSVSKPKRKSKRQSILKFLLANRAANASDGHFLLEVDTALSSLSNHSLSAESKVKRIQTANKRLEELEAAIEHLEVELEYMFRHLIQTRVSLLNILNQ